MVKNNYYNLNNRQKYMKILKPLQNYPLESAKPDWRYWLWTTLLIDHFYCPEPICLTKSFNPIPVASSWKWRQMIRKPLAWSTGSIKSWFLPSISLLNSKRRRPPQVLVVSVIVGLLGFPCAIVSFALVPLAASKAELGQCSLKKRSSSQLTRSFFNKQLQRSSVHLAQHWS